MSCEGQKGSQLPEATTFADSDFVLGFVDEGGGNLVTKKIRKDNFSTGPQGEQGDQGPAGPTGPAGESSEWLTTVERTLVTFTGGSTSVGRSWTNTTSASTNNNATANTPDCLGLTTSTTLNNSTFWEENTTQNYLHGLNHQAVLALNVKEASGTRAWVGFADNTGTAMFSSISDTPGASNFVGFRYSGANWIAVTYNGTISETDTTVAMSTTVMQTFRIEWVRGGSAIEFYIDNVLVATHTRGVENVPAANTVMRLMAGVKNIVGGLGSTKNFHVYTIKQRSGIAT